MNIGMINEREMTPVMSRFWLMPHAANSPSDISNPSATMYVESTKITIKSQHSGKW